MNLVTAVASAQELSRRSGRTHIIVFRDDWKIFEKTDRRAGLRQSDIWLTVYSHGIDHRHIARGDVSKELRFLKDTIPEENR